MKKIGFLASLCVLAAAGVLGLGCGSSAGLSCDETVAGFHYCYTYSNLTSAQNTAEASACTAAKGTTPSSCSTTNSLGSCAASLGGVTFSETYYTSTGLTAASAQMACTSGGGTWTAK